MDEPKKEHFLKSRITPDERELYQQGLGVRFEEVISLVKQVLRVVNNIQKSQDMLFADRQILEDIMISMSQYKSMSVLNREHQDSMFKQLQSEIQEMKTSVNDVGDTLDKKQDVQKNTVILKDPSLIDKVKQAIQLK